MCRAGTHREEYKFDYCLGCARATAPNDAELSDEMCVDCYNRRATKRDQ